MRYGVNATDDQFQGYIEHLMTDLGTEPRSDALDLGAIDYGGIEDVPDSD